MTKPGKHIDLHLQHDVYDVHQPAVFVDAAIAHAELATPAESAALAGSGI